MKPVACVTGASRGIGAAIADRLVQQGFYVVGTATSDSVQKPLERVLETMAKPTIGRYRH
jgi:Short-chain dehydrogenases of various substrate specificities